MRLPSQVVSKGTYFRNGMTSMATTVSATAVYRALVLIYGNESNRVCAFRNLPGRYFGMDHESFSVFCLA